MVGRPTAAILPQNCTRNDLRRPEIQDFPGGGMPPDPSSRRALHTIVLCFGNPGCALVAVPITISLLRACLALKLSMDAVY